MGFIFWVWLSRFGVEFRICIFKFVGVCCLGLFFENYLVRKFRLKLRGVEEEGVIMWFVFDG